MSITQHLIKLDPSLELHDEAEWSGATGSNHQAFNSGGIECETGEFLYGLIRLIKPQYILETGTHHGVGASYMGMALKDNGFGELHTFEFLPENLKIARERIIKLDLHNFVKLSLMDIAEYIPEFDYDMILLDTEPQTRFNELLQFYKNVKEGGFIFIHDLHRHMHQIENKEHGFAWPFGKLPEKIKNLVKKDKLKPFHFETPRGLTGLYKASRKDYKWQ